MPSITEELIKAEKNTLSLIMATPSDCVACKEQAIEHHKALIDRLEILRILEKNRTSVYYMITDVASVEEIEKVKAWRNEDVQDR